LIKQILISTTIQSIGKIEFKVVSVFSENAKTSIHQKIERLIVMDLKKERQKTDDVMINS